MRYNIERILEHVDNQKAREFVRNFDFGAIPEVMRALFCPVCGNVLRTGTECKLGFHFDSNEMRCFRKISRGIKYDTKEGD